MKKIIYAFTLVELIVVVTILGILSTIGFVSYASYLSGVRDSNRLSSITAISDGLEMYRTRNKLPHPDDNIEIKANGITIGWQGDVAANVLNTIEYTKGGLDPKDGSYYTYYLTRDRRNYQIMGYLEKTLEENQLSQNNATIFAENSSYKNRTIYVSGKNIGVLTGTGDDEKVPVNKMTRFVYSGSVDIVLTTDILTAHLDNSTTITGDGTILSAVSTNASCKRLYELGNHENGIYEINPTGTNSYEVYCNMELAGGGWTLIATTADDGKNTWTYNNRNNLKDNIPIGQVRYRTSDYKSQAYSELIFKDMLFLDKQGVWGAYDNMNLDYNQTVAQWLPMDLKCPFNSGRDYDMSSGNVSKNVGVDNYQQDRKLFFTVYDNELGCNPSSPPSTAWSSNAIGPTWGYRNNNGYSPDDPGGMGWGLHYSGYASHYNQEAGDARLGQKSYTVIETNDGDYIMWFVR